MNNGELCKKAVSNMPFGFSVVDREGSIVDFNGAAEKITGYAREDVIGRSHFEILHGSSDPDTCPLSRRAIQQNGKTVSAETTLKNRGGEDITIEITSFPLYEESGDLTGGVEIFRDVTEIRRRERERKRFLSMFVHDMKNPVISAKGFLTRISEGKAGPLTDKQRDYLESVTDSIEKVETLVLDFLEFSKFESKEYKPSLRKTDLSRLLKKSADSIRAQAKEKNVRVILEDKGEFREISIDGTMISRVLDNLLNNALKYTEEGGTVRMICREYDGQAIVQVINSGAVIPDNDLPYVFDAFYRARKDEKGSGLGLAISRKMVELHKGRIWAEVSPEQETVFSFTLPLS